MKLFLSAIILAFGVVEAQGGVVTGEWKGEIRYVRDFMGTLKEEGTGRELIWKEDCNHGWIPRPGCTEAVPSMIIYSSETEKMDFWMGTARNQWVVSKGSETFTLNEFVESGKLCQFRGEHQWSIEKEYDCCWTVSSTTKYIKEKFLHDPKYTHVWCNFCGKKIK